MFSKMKNIDTAFGHVRSFTMLVILGSTIICCYTLYKSLHRSPFQYKVYILVNGNALEALLG